MVFSIRKLVVPLKGFTLLELVVAVGLLALVVASLAPLFSGSYRHITDSGKKTQAAFLAQGKMEYLKNLGYESLLNNGGSPAGFSFGKEFAGFTAQHEIKKTVLDAGGYPVKGLIITVDVLYENQEKKASINSFIREP